MPHHARLFRTAPALSIAAALAVAGCGSAEENPTDSESPSATPHGYIEGAEESAEQQSRLLLADPETGEAQIIDLITEETHDLSAVPGTTELTTDGRFGYFHGPNEISVVDSGAWMVDHGDHVHYYRADINDVGPMPGDADTVVRSDAGVTVAAGDNSAEVYEREQLEDGAIGDPQELDGEHAGVVVPFAEHLLAPTPDESTIAVFGRDGSEHDEIDGSCADPSDGVETRRGVVFACAGGALLVSEDDGEFRAEEIDYPDEAGDATERFTFRPGSDSLTARTDDGVVVIDLAEPDAEFVDTGPVVATNTAGEDTPLLTIAPDGTLRGYDIETGEVETEDDLLSDVDGDDPNPVIEVDTSRAYVNDPEGNEVHEIDYNDDLRVARSFDTDVSPGLMVETGR